MTRSYSRAIERACCSRSTISRIRARIILPPKGRDGCKICVIKMYRAAIVVVSTFLSFFRAVLACVPPCAHTHHQPVAHRADVKRRDERLCRSLYCRLPVPKDGLESARILANINFTPIVASLR